VPLNRAVEEPAAIGSVSAQLPSLTKKKVEDSAHFIDTVEQKTTEQAEAAHFPSFVYIHPQEQSTPLLPEHSTTSNPLEYRDESEHQLPHLTKQAVHDGTVFMEKAEQQQKTENVSQKAKDVGTESEVPIDQLPNLTTKAVHDGAVFMDQAEHQKFNTQKAKGNAGGNLKTETVLDGSEFLDVVENSGQSI